MNKKYFSISEVCQAANISAHKLRYLETSIVNFKIIQIRNRRYYTEDNILQICKFLGLHEQVVLSNLQQEIEPGSVKLPMVQLSLFAAPLEVSNQDTNPVEKVESKDKEVVSKIDELLAKLTGLV